MRLPWFFNPHKRRDRGGNSRRRKGSSLRVRPLERRRVLNAAIQSVAVPAVASEGSLVTATATATGQGQLSYDWSFTQGNTTLATGSDPSFSFTPPDDGNYSVNLAVTDSTQISDSKSVGLLVNNRPPVLTVAADQMMAEGHLLDLTGNANPLLGLFVDDGKLDTHTATVDWGDGNPVEPATVLETPGTGSGVVTGTHTYADDGTYQVTVTVFDNYGDSDAEMFQVVVNNVPPVLTVAADQMVAEGHLLDLTGNANPLLGLFVDDGKLDTHTATVDWGDGNPVEPATVLETPGTGSGVVTGTHTYADDGTYQVTVTVFDNYGDSDAEMFQVVVNNVPPVLTVAADQMVAEGHLLDLTGNANPLLGLFVDDGKLDTHTATVDWGDGSLLEPATVLETPNSGSGVVTGTHTYADDGTYQVTVTVFDNYGDSDTQPFNVTVKNQPPVLTVAADQMVAEGHLLDLTGNANPLLGLFVDDGKLDTHTATVDWGDGSLLEPATVLETPNSGSGVVTGTHTYADDGNYTVTVTVIDNFGDSDAEMFTVKVNNVPPQLINITGSTIDENGLATITSNVQDPGVLDTFVVDVNWQDGSNPDQIIGLGASNTSGMVGHTSYQWTAATRKLQLFHQYLDDGPSPGNGTASDTYHVALTVTDNFPDSTSTTADVIVNNVRPVLVVTGDKTVDEGQLLDLTGNASPLLGLFVDTGTLDKHSATVDWGDGSTLDTPVINEANGSGSLSGSHTYADDGTYTVKVTVSDDDLGTSDVQTFTVAVNNVKPMLTVTPTPPTTIDEGSSVSFDASFTDPGFDNKDNPNPATPAITDPTHESFTYDVNWGDGRDAITGMPVADTNGGPGVDSSGAFSGSHTYADDGTYTVTVTIHDDNGGTDFKTFVVMVNNVKPMLTVTPTSPTTIGEGSAVSFDATFKDPGFDNPNNPTTPATGDPLNESFHYFVDWGDGRDQVPNMPVTDTNGMPGTPSTGMFDGSHTYADDGTYTVTVRIADDNMSGNFTGGINGVDYVEQTFDVTVNNVKPMLTVTPTIALPISIDEGTSVGFNATFKDPGFDNPSNPNPAVPPSITDPLAESFTYDVDWGDGRDAIIGMSVADTNGGPGVDSTGAFTGSHTYADDGMYMVTVTIHDDNGGTDFKTFTVTVNNVKPMLTVTPTLALPIAIDEGTSVGFNATFKDPGFDNPNNPTTPATGDPLAESFTYDVDWGDGRDAIPVTAVTDTNGSPGTPSTGSFSADHTYADDGTYLVTVTIHDDNGGTDFKTFTVTVNNVKPTFTSFVPSPTTIDEGKSVSFNAKFTDPGFDNPNNPTTPATGDPLAESFKYDVDWGDGRDAINAMPVADANGGPDFDSTGAFTGSHTYADDGTYLVTVTIHDDNGGTNFKTFTVTVNNVDPTLTGTSNLPPVDEGQAFTLTGLGVGFKDPGFDNPNNPTIPATGDPLAETFAIQSIDWGDGSMLDTNNLSIVNRVSGSPGVATTAQFSHSPHTYADDGTYTVTITYRDDNGPFVAETLQITVKNVAPTLSLLVGDQSILESGDVVLPDMAKFSDPGFDNPNNPTTPPTGDRFNESFTFDIDWGDGRDTVTAMSVADINGSPGTSSKGMFGGSHNYADNGFYTVKLAVHDDNGGVSQVLTFHVTVTNISPSFVPKMSGNFEGDSVNIQGITSVRVGYTDPGYDNPLNTQDPANGGQVAETPVYVVDWGDGTIDAMHRYAVDGTYTVTVTITPDGGSSQTFTFAGFNSSTNPVLTLVNGQTLNGPQSMFTYVVNWGEHAVNGSADATTTLHLSLATPGNPVLNTSTFLVNKGFTQVLSTNRASGSALVLTKGSSEIQHQYLGPPDPLHPTADIKITMIVADDDDAQISDFILVANPGIQTQMVAIDTTPDIARLEFPVPAAAVVFAGQQASSTESLQTNDNRAAAGEMAATTDRFFELRVVFPDDTEGQGYRIKDEALNNLRDFFKTLPDGKYRVYLVRTENNSRRLVIEISVRRGHVIDVSDESEGTRDRPPTSEDQGHQAKPLNENPQLEAVPGGFGDGSPATPVEFAARETATRNETESKQLRIADFGLRIEDVPQSAMVESTRRAAAFTGLGLVAAARPWSEEVDEALAEANERTWQRLRRAGRRGRFRQQNSPNPANPVQISLRK